MIGLRGSGASTRARLAANPMPHAWRRIGYLILWHGSHFMGSRFFAKSPPGDARLLNLGSGARRYAGFVNADAYDVLGLVQRPRERADWLLDAGRRWRCPDDYWSGIFCEHMLEHLYYPEAVVCVSEAFRTLRRGGVLRLVVPDAERYVQFCRDEVPEAPFASAPEALSNLTQNWGHHSVWNAALLCALLRETGFTDVRTERFGSGAMPELLRDTPERAWESCYVEARKG